MTMLPNTTKGLILDMDGVLWTDSTPIGNLPGIFARIKDSGMGVVMATNNSTKTVDQYVERLAGFGVSVEPWQIVTSALAVVEIMKRQLPSGAPVFVIGEQGLQENLRLAGFELLSPKHAEKAEALVMGLDRSINFEKMVEATLLVRTGKPFYATNPDITFPTPRGIIPGAGAWISVVVTATDIQPVYAGKPFPFILELALNRLNTPKENTFVIGDRLDTDIAGGQALGCPTAMVLTGISTFSQAEKWVPKVDLIADNLSHLVGAS